MTERVVPLVFFSLELRLLGSRLFFTFGGIPRVSQLGFWLHYPPCDIYGNDEQHRDLEQEQVCRSARSRRVGCQRFISLTRQVFLHLQAT